VVILKDRYKKEDWGFGFHPGNEIYMNSQKVCINADLFCKWFREISVPEKAPGPNLLILDGMLHIVVLQNYFNLQNRTT
jgi:hypothetical protein